MNEEGPAVGSDVSLEDLIERVVDYDVARETEVAVGGDVEQLPPTQRQLVAIAYEKTISAWKSCCKY